MKVCRCKVSQVNHLWIIVRTLLDFKLDIPYVTTHINVDPDSSSQADMEAFVNTIGTVNKAFYLWWSHKNINWISAIKMQYIKENHKLKGKLSPKLHVYDENVW